MRTQTAKAARLRAAESPIETPAADQEETARLAHSYWEAEGCPEGRDVEHWLRAEAKLKEEARIPAD